MKKNNKGFTLVELLVVIVIIGVISTMSWPVITRLQEGNEISKYEKYGEAMVAAAKLYMDSYEEDLFQYEDDMTDERKAQGSCAYISYDDLKEHMLIKDFNSNDISCNSDSTFVRIIRKNGRYSYKYYLGCGKKKANGAKLTDSEVYYTLPTPNKLNVKDLDACNNQLTEYKLTFDSRGGTVCPTKTAYTDGTTTETWGSTCTPILDNYTFVGWNTKPNGTGTVINNETVVTGNVTAYAQWRKNQVIIEYHTNGGTLAPNSGATISTEDNLILLNGSSKVQTVNFDTKLESGGLWNYNSAGYINITKGGYHAVDGAEWNTAPDGSGKSYDQGTRYKASEFCDATQGDCIVRLYVNWKANKIYIRYNINGGALKTPYYNKISVDSNGWVTYNGSTIIHTLDFGDTLSVDGLWNYNNTGWLNVGMTGHYAKAGAEWNTKANGKGTSYNQAVSYKSEDFCTAEYSDCNIDLYVNWVPAKVIIHYNANGGVLLPKHASHITMNGNDIYSYGTQDVQTFNYGSSTGVDGLLNYDNHTWLNIGKVGYHAIDGKEWCVNPDGTGKTFDHDLEYAASDFCDASNGDCVVTLYANWTGNKAYIIQHPNGGTLASAHSSTITQVGEEVFEGGSRIFRIINYNSNMVAAGLYDYNNPSALNIVKPGFIAKPGAEWCLTKDGTGSTFNQATVYRDDAFCDATYYDCTATVYVNWIPAP